MDSYRVVMTSLEKSQMEEIIEYLTYNLWNKYAAEAVRKDALRTINKLKNAAESYRYCEDEELKKLGYRKIIFSKHKYVYIYRVIDDVAIIEAVYHQSQDYENIFAEDIGIG